MIKQGDYHMNIDLTDDLVRKLNYYDGVLPILLLPYVDFSTYKNHLKELPDYDVIMREFNDVRLELLGADDKDRYRENQLKEWLMDNKEIGRLIEIE